MSWVNSSGISLPAQAWEMTANGHVSEAFVFAVLKGDALADVSMLAFLDPESFAAGELHRYSGSWSRITSLAPCNLAVQVLNWIENYVEVHDFFNISRVVTKANLMTLRCPLQESSSTICPVSRFFSSPRPQSLIGCLQVPFQYEGKLVKSTYQTWLCP